MRSKRRKVQRAHLERRLYKTERRIEKFSLEANTLRQAIKVMDEQNAKQRTDILESKEILTAAVAANKKIKEGYDAGDRGK